MRMPHRATARRSLVRVTLALLAAGCTDGIEPPSPKEEGPHFLRWAGATQPRFNAVGAAANEVADGGLLASPGGLSLDGYTAAFWAVRGAYRSVQINYLDASGEADSPFLRLHTFDPVFVPGRGELAQGDSVLITVIVDSENLAVTLEPTGLVFGYPAAVQVWYGGADGDLNGDGAVNDADAYIESQLLGIWYREGGDDPWAKISAYHSLSGKWFATTLKHFSQYAVSW